MADHILQCCLCFLSVGVITASFVFQINRIEFDQIDGAYLWPFSFHEISEVKTRAQCGIMCMRNNTSCGGFRLHSCSVCTLITHAEIDNASENMALVQTTHGPNEFYTQLPPVYRVRRNSVSLPTQLLH